MDVSKLGLFAAEGGEAITKGDLIIAVLGLLVIAGGVALGRRL